jgi:hypothetical protein
LQPFVEVIREQVSAGIKKKNEIAKRTEALDSFISKSHKAAKRSNQMLKERELMSISICSL